MRNLIFVGLTAIAVAQPPGGMDPSKMATMPKEAMDAVSGQGMAPVDYGEKWINVPKNKIKPKVEGRPLNVLVMGYFQGSIWLSQSEVARELAAEKAADGTPKFNVTLVVNQDYDYAVPETDNLHVFKTPLNNADFPQSEKGVLGESKRVNTNALRLLSSENAEWTRSLKALKIDLMVQGPISTDSIIAEYLGVDSLKFMTYLVDPIKATLNVEPMQILGAPANLIPMHMLAGLDSNNVLFKGINLVAGTLLPSLIQSQFGNSDTMLPEFHNKLKLEHSFGYGVEGLRDVVQWAPNTAAFNPLSRFSSNSHPETELKAFSTMEGFHKFKDFIEFIDKWENIVLISFGTNQPSQWQLMNLMEAVRQVNFTGFIVSINDGQFLKDVSALNLTNILIKSSVPQEELLALPKVTLFISHCGGREVASSLYNGTPMLGFPIDGDQMSACKKLENMGVGVYGDISAKPDKIAAQISKIVGEKMAAEKRMDLDNRMGTKDKGPQLDKTTYQGKAQFYKKIMAFEEVRGGKSIGYWANHVSRFGVDHLISPHHSMGWVELYDLDIKAYICATLLSLYLAFCLMTRVKSPTP